jgi:protein-S-isoprenylcysteine O-methyltransferase Ste14
MTEDNTKPTHNSGVMPTSGTAAVSTVRAGTGAGGPGVRGKPVQEKLKLLGTFALLGVLLWKSQPTPIGLAVGMALVAAGTLIRVWAAGHLTRDQKLTTSGPYQYTRNPLYLGRLLLLIGFAVMSGLRHPMLIGVFVLALVIFFGYYMPRKEQREGGRLRDLFGPDYEEWKANVPSLFPRLTPYRMQPRAWSAQLFMGGDDCYSGNKELWTTLSICVLCGLFLWRMVL